MNETGPVVTMLALVESDYERPPESAKVICLSTRGAVFSLDSLAAVADLKRSYSRIADYWPSLVVVLGRPYYWSAL